MEQIWAETSQSRRRFRLDGYDVGEVIGRGGFAVVYAAREEAFDRTVAIKVVTVPMDDVTRRRFDVERRSMGAVSSHPNVVAVYASGFDELERPYLVMEHMASGSLAERIASRGGLGWVEAVDIGVKLAGALETAHRGGILHRDIKPENVLMSAYGEPHLADFGISRVPGGHQTRSGVVTATPLHAAPEVLTGGSASVASEVYSLASTVFALIAGAAPFQDDTDEHILTLLHRVVTAPVPDLRSRGVPDAVCRVLERAMAKSGGERPRSAAEFGEQLRAAQQQLGLAASSLPVVVDEDATVRVDAVTTAVSVADERLDVAPEPPRAGRRATRRRARKVRYRAAIALGVIAVVAGALTVAQLASSSTDTGGARVVGGALSTRTGSPVTSTTSPATTTTTTKEARGVRPRRLALEKGDSHVGSSDRHDAYAG
jgi:serine/threonine protein kinase